MTGRTLTHGTQTGYAYHRCRCADCTDAHRLAEAGRRARRAARLAADQDIPHGKPNGYSTFGCRCEPCRQAISEYRRDLRQRRKNGDPIRKLAPRRPAPAPPECERLHADAVLDVLEARARVLEKAVARRHPGAAQRRVEVLQLLAALNRHGVTR